jgi:hypothetical protein
MKSSDDGTGSKELKSEDGSFRSFTKSDVDEILEMDGIKEPLM